MHRVNPELAARIAAEMGETLVTLRIVDPPRPPEPPAQPAGPPPRPAVPVGDLADSIVCAAAEAAQTTPQSIRTAILAAFDRAASVHLAVDEVRAALRAAEEAKRGGQRAKA